MKKFVNFLCLLFILSLPVGFSSCTKPPVDKILDITISENFYSEYFYVGEDVDLRTFSVTISYTISPSEVFPLSSVLRSGLDTSVAGVHNFELSYLGYKKSFRYSVHEPVIVDAIYRETPLEFYLHEEINLDGKCFTILLSSGEEKEIPLSLVTFPEIAGEASSEIKHATVSYKGIEFTVPYTVTARVIESGKMYLISSDSDAYKNKYVCFADGHLKIYDNNQGLGNAILCAAASCDSSCQSTVFRFSIIEEDIVRYEAIRIYDKVLIKNI